MTIIVYYLMGAYIHTSVRTIKYESMYERHPILLLSYRIVSCLNIWRNKMDFKIEIELNYTLCLTKCTNTSFTQMTCKL